MASKKSGAKKASVSKADFVRGLPHASPREVVEKAKAAGIDLSDKHVSAIRSADKKAKARKSGAKGAAGGGGHIVTPRGASAKDRLIAAAVELGIERATRILDTIRDA